MTPKANRAYLASLGIEGWADPAKIGTPKFKWIPLAKIESSHLGCMVERFKSREAAKIGADAQPCFRHEGEVVGDCPRCRGIWPDEPTFPPAPMTLAEFEEIRS